jgi:hypothetical protein
MKWTPEMKRRARLKAFNQWAELVLAEPESFHPLRVERVRQGLTAGELGAMPSVRLHKYTIGKIERGLSPGNNITRYKLAKALNREINELFPS